MERPKNISHTNNRFEVNTKQIFCCPKNINGVFTLRAMSSFLYDKCLWYGIKGQISLDKFSTAAVSRQLNFKGVKSSNLNLTLQNFSYFHKHKAKKPTSSSEKKRICFTLRNIPRKLILMVV